MSWQKRAVVTFSAVLWEVLRFPRGVFCGGNLGNMQFGASLLLAMSNDVYVFLSYWECFSI